MSNKETHELALVAAERQVASLLRDLQRLAINYQGPARETALVEWANHNIYDDPTINTARFSQGITKSELDERLGYESIESDFQAAKAAVKFCRLEKLHWARYLLSFVLPRSKAYLSVRARNVSAQA